MRVLGCEEPHNCVDLHNVCHSEWHQMMKKIDCVFHCMTGWYNMRSIYPKVSRIHTLHCLGRLYDPWISVRPHRPVNSCQPCIVIHPSLLSHLPRWVELVVRNLFSGHTSRTIIMKDCGYSLGARTTISIRLPPASSKLSDISAVVWHTCNCSMHHW
jgi:hypothetical protein